MVNTIKIYNPKDKPYGVLSNNAVSQFTIGDKRYRSVSNFIWSNMYPVQGIIKNVLANNNPNDVKKDYELEIEQVTYTSPITLIDGVGTALFPTINSYLYWNTEVNYKLKKEGILVGEGTTNYVNKNIT